MSLPSEDQLPEKFGGLLLRVIATSVSGSIARGNWFAALTGDGQPAMAHFSKNSIADKRCWATK
jgi:hypothetical protein